MGAKKRKAEAATAAAAATPEDPTASLSFMQKVRVGSWVCGWTRRGLVGTKAVLVPGSIAKFSRLHCVHTRAHTHARTHTHARARAHAHAHAHRR